MTPRHDGCPWVGPCNCERDAARCKCRHQNLLHSFGWHLEKRPGMSCIGLGECGYCDCTAFDPAPADWWHETALRPLFEETYA